MTDPFSPNSLFDTHLHLYEEDNAKDIFEAAREQGVGRFVVIGTCMESSLRAMQIARGNEGVYAAVGVHPHEAADCRDVEPFRELLQDANVIAVGEVGLDYFYEHSPKEEQIRLFKDFLTLAGEEKMPVVMHCRDAYEDCLPVLEECLSNDCNLLIHSYTGTAEWARKAMKFNAWFSINGIYTFNGAKNVRQAFEEIPVGKIVLETDAPYLAPPPYRGKRNQPAYLPAIAAKLAAEKAISPVDAAAITTANALDVFKLES